jgi:hypothetical protein
MTKLAKTVLAALALFGSVIVLPQNAFADDWVSCQPIEVIEKTSMVHVKCADAVTVDTNANIRYLAIAKTDVAAVGRFIALANAALLSGKTFRAYGLSNIPANPLPSGCSATDCRSVKYFGVMN